MAEIMAFFRAALTFFSLRDFPPLRPISAGVIGLRMDMVSDYNGLVQERQAYGLTRLGMPEMRARLLAVYADV